MREHPLKRGSPSQPCEGENRYGRNKSSPFSSNKSDVNSSPLKNTIKIWAITTAEEEKAAEEVNDEGVVAVVDVLPRDGTEVRSSLRNLGDGTMGTDLVKMTTIRVNTGARNVTSVRISSRSCAGNSQPLRNRYVLL